MIPSHDFFFFWNQTRYSPIRLQDQHALQIESYLFDCIKLTMIKYYVLVIKFNN